MPIIFKQYKREKSPFRPTSGSIGSQKQRPQSSKNLLSTATRTPSRHGGLRASFMARRASFMERGSRARASFIDRSTRARHSIYQLKYRIRERGIKKYFQNPKLLGPLLKKFYTKHHLNHFLPLVALLLYMLLGAAIFFWLESSADQARWKKRHAEYATERQIFVKKVEALMQEESSMPPPNTSKRRQFVEDSLDNMLSQFSPTSLEPEWTFSTSMYYSGTILTIIGYGDVACTSFFGRIATVLYAIIGIPLMLYTLNEMGKFLYTSINKFVAMLNGEYKMLTNFRFCLHRPRTKKEEFDPENGLMQNGWTVHDHSEEKKVTSLRNDDDRGVSFFLNEVDKKEELGPKILANGSAKKCVVLELNPATLEKDSTDGTDETESDPVEDEENNEEEMERKRREREEAMRPRMHVMIAIFFTVAWILLCAALFQLWENWSYSESLYFMFISLLTIGLGDVYVRRRDLMLFCFIFVIIGLSLVAMCIQVIQSSLADLYEKLLVKLLTDYQHSMSKDGNHKSATFGMMKTLGQSKTAKLIMPLLSENAKRSVMQQVQEEAKEVGIEIPPILENFDEFNKIIDKLSLANDQDAKSDIIDEILEDMDVVSQSETTISSKESRQFLILTDNQTQTDDAKAKDRHGQTKHIALVETCAQTQISVLEIPHRKDAAQQTDNAVVVSKRDKIVQTTPLDIKNEGTAMSVKRVNAAKMESRAMNTLYLLDEGEHCDLSPPRKISMRNRRIQTPSPILVDSYAQSEEHWWHLELRRRAYAALDQILHNKIAAVAATVHKNSN